MEGASINETAPPKPDESPPPNVQRNLLSPSTLTASDRLRAFQNSALRFLSNASNETLGACAVGLAASTYLVLGRLGLVLIGAVGGIVLHANWEAQGDYKPGTGDDPIIEGARKKKELGIQIVNRVLDWRDKKHDRREAERGLNTLEVDQNDTADPAKPVDYLEFPPDTRKALDNLTDAIIRDYVKWWYSPLLPKEQSFPTACRQTLTKFVLSFSHRLKRKRAADPVLDFFANSTSIIIVFLNELGTALKASQRQDAQDAIRTYLKYQPESSLANVLSVEQQERKLNIVADDILQNFLESPSHNCPPVKAFLREVLSGLILQPLIVSCAKPEWINGWIVHLLEDGEPELLNVIDAGVEDMSEAVLKKSPGSEQETRHQRRVSRAEEAMQQAMQEAERLNAMIAEEEARRKREVLTAESDDAISSSATEAGPATPTSSDSDKNRRSTRSSFLLDSEGNAVTSAQPSPSKEPATFTSFDQIGDSLQASTVIKETAVPPLTLHNAFITLIDMGEGNDRVALKKEPTEDEYLVQIEPASSRYPGWMITRRYPDFTKLHQSISVIARISGAPTFNNQYSVVPTWRGLTRPQLKSSLELYLRDALKYERLAESESMKKFLGKETGVAKGPAQSKNILVQGGAALENVGKNFVNVLGQGSKGIAGGGKAVFGGVQGVFGAVATGVGGPKKATPSQVQHTPAKGGPFSSTTPSRPSQEVSRESSQKPPLPARPLRMSSDYSQISSRDGSPARRSHEVLNLPSPPEVITNDYEPVSSMTAATPPQPASMQHSSRSETPNSTSHPLSEDLPAPIKQPGDARTSAPISEEETRVIIDLMFAIITELYSLSSAWTIRLSLLTAAKSFLLRPANPQLDSIRALLQESMLDANLSDRGLSTHINKLRENSVPTEEEMAQWPRPLGSEEKEKLRVRARKLLVERGMPQALTSVMGAAASGEALGKVFDCLQIEEVAKGLIFALLLQAIRAATQ